MTEAEEALAAEIRKLKKAIDEIGTSALSIKHTVRRAVQCNHDHITMRLGSGMHMAFNQVENHSDTILEIVGTAK
jgi:hypothetical protein